MDYRKINFWQLVILALLLNFVGQTMHEAGHWVIYESLGLGPVWGFIRAVQIWDDVPLNTNDMNEQVIPFLDTTKYMLKRL